MKQKTLSSCLVPHLTRTFSQSPFKSQTLVSHSICNPVAVNIKSLSDQAPSSTQWPKLCWNVSKPWLPKVDFLKNHAIVAMRSDNVTFYAWKIINVTSGFNLKKTIFFARRRHLPKNSWNIFQIQITPLLWRTPQNPEISKNGQKTIIFCCFCCHFWVFFGNSSF